MGEMWNRSFLVYKYWARSQTLVLKKWKSVVPVLEKGTLKVDEVDELLLQIHCYEYTL